jgi:hypothetical protein
MPQSLPPHALAAPAFPFRNLAALAARAPIGGAREVALACFVAARLASDQLEGKGLPEAGRAARSAGAKGWLGTLALPAPVRGPLARCMELSASPEGGGPVLAAEVAALAEVAGGYLDQPARAELAALGAALAGRG